MGAWGETMAPEITEEGFTGEGDRGPSESRPGVRQCEAGPGTGEGDSSADTRLSCGYRGQRGLWGFRMRIVTEECVTSSIENKL